MTRIRQFYSLFLVLVLILLTGFWSCQGSAESLPTIGFVDAFEDDTIAKARVGFFDALAEAGYSEADTTLSVIYRNAQGDIPTLTQIVRYMLSRQVDLIATCPSLSTITALQNTREVPVCMMVSPTPELMQVMSATDDAPANLFGVAENLGYIDTSFSLIPKLLGEKSEPVRVGLLYNQSEPQSVDAFNRIQQIASRENAVLVGLPVNTSADVQLVAAALLNEGVDAFFAMPDNTIFAAFETILQSCEEAGVPIFTSEAGLVARGAVAAYGADLYAWGQQAGRQAAQMLDQGSSEGLSWELVKVRRKVYRPDAVERYGLTIPEGYEVFGE